MLGYLSLEGGRADVNGLRPGMANMHDGTTYEVHHLEQTRIPGPEWDPDHSSREADRQIAGGRMDGFAESYAATLARRHVKSPDAGLVMGYFNAEDLPIYDHFAAEFCVCDAWHSSVPGATWPNPVPGVRLRRPGTREHPLRAIRVDATRE